MKVVKKRLSTEQIQDLLAAFEQKYEMSSLDFYRKYTRGETDDRRDFVRWAGLCNMLAIAKVHDTIHA